MPKTLALLAALESAATALEVAAGQLLDFEVAEQSEPYCQGAALTAAEFARAAIAKAKDNVTGHELPKGRTCRSCSHVCICRDTFHQVLHSVECCWSPCRYVEYHGEDKK